MSSDINYPDNTLIFQIYYTSLSELPMEMFILSIQELQIQLEGKSINARNVDGEGYYCYPARDFIHVYLGYDNIKSVEKAAYSLKKLGLGCWKNQNSLPSAIHINMSKRSNARS